LDRRTALIIVAVVAAVSVVAVSVAWLYFSSQDEEFSFSDLLNIFNPEDNDDSEDLLDLDDEEIPDRDDEDCRLPSAISIFVNPSVVDMGDWILGTASTDGYNFAITTKVAHKGSGQSQSVAGWVDSDGRYELAQPVNLPGYWEFQTTAENGVKSNVAYLTVRGIQVNLEASHYSKTFRDSLELRALTHYAGADVLFVAINHDTGTSTPLGTARANSGGYATLSYNFDSFANGNYDIDAIVGSDSATSWSATAWLEIGR